jgi:Fic/DOC family
MDLPMAAKKTRKPTKKPRPKATKATTSGKRTPRTAAKKRAPAKAKVKKTVAKAKRPAARPAPRPARASSSRPKKSKKAAPPKRPAARKPEVKRPAPVEKRPVEKRPVEASGRDGGSPSRPRAIAEKKALAKAPPRSSPPPSPSSKPSAKASVKNGGGSSGPYAPASGVPTARRSAPGKAPSKPPGKPAKEKPSLRGPGRAPLREAPARLVALPLPILVAPKRPSVEERAASVEGRLMAQTEDFRKAYEERLDMSWIFHDSALEGVVYTFEELRTALSGQAPPVTDSSLQPTYDDIRRHKEAIEFVRDYGLRKKLPVTVDIIKKIYLILHPEEGDIKTVKYRKDIPQHRLYFHEYAPPDKIAYKVRQIVDWLNDPETRKTRNGVRIAARAHYDLLRVYPFPTDSGKVSRLFMNLMLMRTGLPPAIVHSTERQRYYEALKGSATTVLQMVQEAVENALSSVEKLLDEHETRKRAFVS